MTPDRHKNKQDKTVDNRWKKPKKTGRKKFSQKRTRLMHYLWKTFRLTRSTTREILAITAFRRSPLFHRFLWKSAWKTFSNIFQEADSFDFYECSQAVEIFSRTKNKEGRVSSLTKDPSEIPADRLNNSCATLRTPYFQYVTVLFSAKFISQALYYVTSDALRGLRVPG